MNVFSPEKNLWRLIDLARRHKKVSTKLDIELFKLFKYLGWTDHGSANFRFSLLDEEVMTGLPVWEASLMKRMPSPALIHLESAMAGRAEQVVAKFAQYLKPDVSVLDLGGGSGEIAELMATDGRNLLIADVRDWRRNLDKTEFALVVRNDIYVLKDSSDIVTALHTWHHSSDPEVLVKETFRVVKPGGRVIIIETVADDLEEFLYTCFIDWFYNRILHYEHDPADKVPVPCQFRSAAGWEQLIIRLFGLTPTVSTNLGVYQSLAPLHHHLFVYDLP